MNSLRKWFNRPKKSDSSLLAQFFFADEELNEVAAELDSFDGRKDPERCTTLVNKLRACQDKVLGVVQKIIDETIGNQKASRDFRVKFPDDVLQENLSGQLWFGAECLAAGSSIMNREIESASMRPLARALTKNLDSLRTLLREQCLRNQPIDSDRIKESLTIFDKLFAEFELSYVSTMVPVKTMKEYDLTQEVTVLFSETVQRALKKGHIEQDTIDDYDPALMFTIPRLAIVCGLLVFPEGPLNPGLEPSNISEMFRPFQTLLQKIRELLYTLSEKELHALEGALCSAEEPDKILSSPEQKDESSQVDPGFEEESDLSTSRTLTEITRLEQEMTQISDISDDLVTPSQEGPNLPHLPVEDYSPSSTLVDSLDGQESLNSSLNKSESRDSGLQSENVSTSDTVMCDAGTISMTSDSTVICSETPSADSDLKNHDVQALCRDIIGDLVNQVTDRRPPYSRQGSQQYNLNLEIPRISSSANSSPSTSSHSSASSVVFCDKPPQTSVDQSHCSSDIHPSHSTVENKEAHHVCDNAGNTNHVIDTTVCDQSDDPSDPRTSTYDYSHRLPNDSVTDSTKTKSDGTNKGANNTEEPSLQQHPRIQRIRYTTDSVSSSFSSCHSNTYDAEWDRESDESCETSSYNSESNDDEEITLAVQAAELASRKEARARFRSSSDLIHRLFVCISGVADQLQTNYAGDLRNILKCVFDMNCSDPVIVLDENPKRKFDRHPSFMARRTNRYGHRSTSNRPRDPPQWVPDDQMEKCMSCEIPFNFVRRRHHCRSCGKIYCGRCSSNFVPLPHFGYINPVRVCNHCFLFQVTPFTVNE